MDLKQRGEGLVLSNFSNSLFLISLSLCQVNVAVKIPSFPNNEAHAQDVLYEMERETMTMFELKNEFIVQLLGVSDGTYVLVRTCTYTCTRHSQTASHLDNSLPHVDSYMTQTIFIVGTCFCAVLHNTVCLNIIGGRRCWP